MIQCYLAASVSLSPFHVMVEPPPPMMAQSVPVFSPPTILLADQQSTTTATTGPIDILDVIQVYGKLAGPACYGKVAPKGSSCQITRDDLTRKLFGEQQQQQQQFLDLPAFQQRIQLLPFAWPLKPFGVDDPSNLAKTAVMNKSVETRLYMQLLQKEGLYDPRNPAGPLPSSLRPQLNALLQQQQQQEGLKSSTVIERVYRMLLSSDRSTTGRELSKDQLDRFFTETVGRDTLDYYDFLRLLGPNTVSYR